MVSSNQKAQNVAKHAPKTSNREDRNANGTPVAWISRKYGVVWVVSPHRKDKRTGSITCRPASDYAHELFNQMSLGTYYRRHKVEAPTSGLPPVNEIVQKVVQTPKKYILHYDGTNRGLIVRRQYHFIEMSDADAWATAFIILEAETAPVKRRTNAQLFENDREVERP